MAHGRLLINCVWREKRLFAHYIAASHDVSYSLSARVLYCHHQGSIQDEVDVGHLASLSKELLLLSQLDYLGGVNDELVGVEADLGEHLVMQAYFFEAEHLCVRVAAHCRIVELVHKVRHHVLTRRLVLFDVVF